MSSFRQAGKLIALPLLSAILASCARPPSPPEVPTGPIPTDAPTGTALPRTPTAPLATASPMSPTPTAPEPYSVVTGAEDIIGTWMFSDSDFSRYYENGTVHEAYSLGQLDSDPFAVNAYEFEDGRLILRELSVSGVPPCGGKVGVYEIRILQSGGLQIITVKDTCTPRAGDVQGIYERVP